MAQTRSIGVARKACKGRKGRALSQCMKRKMKGPKKKAKKRKKR